MPIDQRAVESIALSVKRFIAEVALEERPTGMLSFPNPEWNFVDFGTATISYRRSETAAALADFKMRFTRRRDWQAKWSTDFIAEEESSLLTGAFSATSDDGILAAVQRAADTLDEEPPKHIVIMPIGGLHFGELVLSFPRIEISTMNEPRLAKLRDRYYTIIDSTPHSIDEKTALRKRVDEMTNLLLNRVCASITLVGDVQMCRYLAVAELEPIVDFFQLMTAIYEPNFKGIQIRLGGDLVTRQPPSLVVKGDGTRIYDEQKLAFDHRLEVDQSKIDQMRTNFGSILKIFAKDGEDRTDFEAVILRSMHWIADADRQKLPENKTTSYITAIEMFFSASDAPITRDVSEGVATIMRSTLAERRELLGEVAALYATRSRISHRGERLENDDNAIKLKNIAVNLLSKLGNMSSSFADLPGLRAWLADQRLQP